MHKPADLSELLFLDNLKSDRGICATIDKLTELTVYQKILLGTQIITHSQNPFNYEGRMNTFDYAEKIGRNFDAIYEDSKTFEHNHLEKALENTIALLVPESGAATQPMNTGIAFRLIERHPEILISQKLLIKAIDMYVSFLNSNYVVTEGMSKEQLPAHHTEVFAKHMNHVNIYTGVNYLAQQFKQSLVEYNLESAYALVKDERYKRFELLKSGRIKETLVDFIRWNVMNGKSSYLTVLDAHQFTQKILEGYSLGDHGNNSKTLKGIVKSELQFRVDSQMNSLEEDNEVITDPNIIGFLGEESYERCWDDFLQELKKTLIGERSYHSDTIRIFARFAMTTPGKGRKQEIQRIVHQSLHHLKNDQYALELVRQEFPALANSSEYSEAVNALFCSMIDSSRFKDVRELLKERWILGYLGKESKTLVRELERSDGKQYL